ncbi:MAG TPA: aromatic ring-hydroxylating dioxygenase subunit alpha [Acidimicrobiales bacterium]|jgi:vanillate O-demethylase monooxygenase subunit|nr:aromatic ring-hydroxylating dioxygenase subunit alpha [Acidimicrobiales bacterium]
MTTVIASAHDTRADESVAGRVGPDPDHVLRNDDRALRACWHPVARSSEITETPTKAWLLSEPLVLYRAGDRAVGFLDRCPHRRAPLSEGTVDDGVLTCAYHGWAFDSAGTCVAIPSLGTSRTLPPKAHLAAVRLCERYGMVFAALEEPIAPLPEVAAFAAGGRHVPLEFEGPYGASLLIDNQLDIAHFAFLHRQTFGVADDPSTPPYAVERDGWGFTSAMEMPISASNDPGVADGTRPLRQHRFMTYRYWAPFHVELTLDYPVMGGSTVVVFFAQPQTAERSRMYVDLFFRRSEPLTDSELADRVAFEQKVFGEDLALQARFDTTDLPLGPGAECHVRADRASVEYRRILAEIVEASR